MRMTKMAIARRMGMTSRFTVLFVFDDRDEPPEGEGGEDGEDSPMPKGDG